MVKPITLIPWAMLLVGTHIRAVPMIIQPPLFDQGQNVTPTINQGEPIDSEGVIKVNRTESALFGAELRPLTREDFEGLQQYASDLEGITITYEKSDGALDSEASSPLRSALDTALKRVAIALDSVLMASAKLWALWSNASSPRKAVLSPEDEAIDEDLKDDDVEDVFQDDGLYSTNDLTANPFDDVEAFEGFVRVLEAVVQSHSGTAETLGGPPFQAEDLLEQRSG